MSKGFSNWQYFLAASLVACLFIALTSVWFLVILFLGLFYGWAWGTGRFEKWLKEPFTKVDEPAKVD